MDRELENYNVQAVGTTLMFSAMIIFGFVFWKIFTNDNIHLLSAPEEARTEIQTPDREVVTRFP